MGFDVYGANPISRSGEYFRNSHGWWLGLWRYCLNLFPGIAGKVERWDTIDGDGLNAEDAMALSRLLEETLKDGTVREYQRGYAEYLAKLPDTKCSRCNGQGEVHDFVELTHPRQADEVPMDLLFPMKLPPLVQCSVCDGTGIESRRNETVPFSEENVERFAEFLRDCGGFAIW